ncbi:MAG: hypothetical protein ACE5DU_08790 [Nitrosopumilus sp.]
MNTQSKILILLEKHMKSVFLQIDESSINQSFEITNNLFEEFKVLTSSIFSQIMDWVSSTLGNF